jgi:hypothetical protein
METPPGHLLGGRQCRGVRLLLRPESRLVLPPLLGRSPGAARLELLQGGGCTGFRVRPASRQGCRLPRGQRRLRRGRRARSRITLRRFGCQLLTQRHSPALRLGQLLLRTYSAS